MDRAALDAAYNNQAAVPAFGAIMKDWLRRSTAVHDALRTRFDLRYGERPRRTLDFIAAREPNAPLLVFIHGGYWQGGDKRSVGFVAKGPHAQGFAVALVEYTVAPEGRLADMVGEVRSALEWLRANAANLGFDADRIVLAGHSAGGQLLCMAQDAPGVIGGIAISGLFELEPIRLCYLNEKLALTPDDVARFSPMNDVRARPHSLTVAVGARELPELIRQSRDYAAAIGAPCMLLGGHDHFTVLDELAAEDGRLCLELGRMVSTR